MHRLLAVLMLVVAPGAALAASEICVQNATAESYVFTLESAEGARARAALAPGAELCLATEGAQAGIAAAYEQQTSIEGCARILPASGRDVLLVWGAFDRCRWASHGQ